MSPTPRDLDREVVRKILGPVASVAGIGSRIAAITEQFLGFPYLKNPLIGAVDQDEVFTVSLQGFDCVTYVETALAMARSSTPEGFIDNMKRIRYSGGIVDWRRRHHYMTQWIQDNGRAGIVQNRASGPEVVERGRHLTAIDGLAGARVRVRSVPKRAFMRRSAEVRTGDLAFFASTRKKLDVFHCGVLIRKDLLLLRHASLSRGQVLDQDLGEFLSANRMSGVILVRPLEVRRLR